MTRVRIIVDDPLLGNVEVEEDDGVASWVEDKQRAAIGRLMTLAIGKVHRAYQLGGVPFEKDGVTA